MTSELTEQVLAQLPCFHEGQACRLYLQEESAYGGAVVLKVARADCSLSQQAEKLANEYRLTAEPGVPGVRRAYAQLQLGGRPALVLEHFAGATLRDSYVRMRRSLTENLEVAIAVATALEGIHRRNIVHCNLSCDHILVAAARPRAVALIDFAHGKLLSSGRGSVPEPVAGSDWALAYMSPEQTGRINRVVDRRTDLYSFGAILYEVLTGRPPFATEETAKLIHCHLAQAPPSPTEMDADVPVGVSEIVLRLLAKNPDERYQSAFGVATDLQNCLAQLQRGGGVGVFALGAADYRAVFRLPDRLYGRADEVRTLEEAVRSAVNGDGQLVIVSGPAGVGKSTLVESVRECAAGLGAVFVKGRYDSGYRNVPYAGLTQAFGEWVDLVLTESASQLAAWKARLLEALGDNGCLMADILPRLELIIGPQPPLPLCGPTEVQHAFLQLCHSFVRALARSERPLVVFLDNMQWADQASLRLLEKLLPDIGKRPIVFVIAYRDDEVDGEHPLATLLGALEPSVPARKIALGNLSLDAINRLIADTLGADEAANFALAQVIVEKTAGTPLFVGQFLQSLHDDGLLGFDIEQRRWSWSLEAVRRREVMGGIGRLVTEKIGRLPKEAQQLLSFAACIGPRLAAADLALAAELPMSAVAERLQPAVDAGLVQAVSPAFPATNGEGETVAEWEFAHERVRQAAYALLPRKERRLTHLRLGRQWLQRTPTAALDEHVFEIADQLNESFQHLTEAGERRQLAELNLAAGRKAKRSAAFQAAIRYFSMGIGMLSAERWECDADLTLNLHLEAIEAEYLSGHFERAALLSTEVLAHVSDRFTRVRVHELRVLFFSVQNRNAEAIEAGRDALQELGVTLPAKPDELLVFAEESQRQLDAAGPVEELAQLPPAVEPRHLAAMKILMHMTVPAQRASPALLRAIVTQMALLARRHGNSPMAAVAYGWYGALLCADVEGIETGYRFGRLSLEVLRRFPESELEMRVQFLFNAYVRHWKEDARECLAPLQEIHRRSLGAGDLETACGSAVHHCWGLFCTGAPLEMVQRILAGYRELTEHSQLRLQSHLIRTGVRTVVALRGDETPDRITGDIPDETEVLADGSALQPSWLSFGALCSRTMLRYVFGDITGAVAAGRSAVDHAVLAYGSLARADHCFYLALALLATPATTADAAPLIARLGRWAVLAPRNFAAKAALAEAEHARVVGDVGRALECFSRAIRLARENGYVQDEALTHEREAAFYRSLGRDDIAGLSLRNAAEAFRSWGATRKVEDLERHFRPLLPPQSAVPLDTMAVVNASHALSQEIRLEQLLEKLMSIVIESAGAQKGILIQRSGGSLLIQARSAVGGGRIETRQGAPVEICGDLALAVVNYAARTLEPVVLADACHDRTFGTEKYIAEHQIRSLLCLPFLYQGKLSGLIYLENNLATNVFTPERLELLKALASQAAISMENAVLYADLEHKIVALQQAEGELRREIEERRRTAEALRQSEEKFRAIFEQTFQFIGVLSVDGTLLQANRSSLAFGGLTEGDVLGKPFWETPWWTHSPALQERLREAIREAAAGKLVRFEASHRAPDGTLHYVDFSLKPITDEAGNVVLLIPEGRDITERKQAEAALRESQALYHSLVEQLPAGVFLKDASGKYVYVNSRFCRLKGVKAEIFLGRVPAEVVVDELAANGPNVAQVGQLAAAAVDHHRQIMETGRTIEIEEHGFGPEGEQHLSVVKSPVFGSDGKIVGSQGIMFDITARKRAEEKVSHLAAIVESTDDAVIGKTLDGEIVSWNHGAEQIYGYAAAEIIGKSVLVLVPTERREELEAIMARLRNGEKIQHLETVRLHKDGRPINVALTISPIKAAYGGIVGASTIARDVTEHKRAEEEMARLHASLEQRVKDRTAELERKNLELERLNKLFIGRELRMVQLKDRMAALERRLPGTPTPDGE
jgi:PAS domain S-box-containing protein